MKQTFVLLSLLAVTTGCLRNELDNGSCTVEEGVTFNAYIAPEDENTKTYMESLHVLWSAQDSISIFQGTTGNSKFKVKNGSEGGTFAVFKRSEAKSGTAIENNVALYPYNAASACTQTGDTYSISLTIPTLQSGDEGTFGQEAFPIVAVTENTGDKDLYFKNIFGLLNLKLKGDVKLCGIGIRALGGEKLSGNATVRCSNADAPSITFAEDATDSVYVHLTQQAALDLLQGKDFYISLPPVTLGGGFRITFTTEYGTITKTASSSIEIKRGNIKKMDVLELKEEEVILDKVRFEDSLFRVYATDNFDTDEDGYISFEEAAQAKEIDLTGKGVTSLKGIEYFTGLERLTCTGKVEDYTVTAGLTIIDLSKNVNLKALNISRNFLTSIDLSNNTVLTDLDCSSNDIKKIDVTMLTSLDSLAVWSCGLSDIDLSNNTALTCLNVSSNSLESLSTDNMTGLKHLICGSNKLESLSLGDNSNLKSLYCQNNLISSLPLTSLPLLSALNCNSNSISALDLSNSKYLTSLDCSYNKIGTLSIPAGPMQELYCDSNEMTSLDVSKLPYLSILTCTGNKFSTLDLSENQSLTKVLCYGNTPADMTIYLTKGQTISSFSYDREANIRYKDQAEITYTTVDLGLSVLWYTTNVGASSKEKPGYYYAWGETATKSSYGWDNYAHCNYQGGYVTKYTSSDQLSTLESADDVATAVIKGGARIPTLTEWNEMFQNCSANLAYFNGVAGILFTSNVAGYTDNQMFLPIAGYKSGSDLVYDGTMSYWSSTPILNYYNSLYTYCAYYKENRYGISYVQRYTGIPVRAVKDKTSD